MEPLPERDDPHVEEGQASTSRPRWVYIVLGVVLIAAMAAVVLSGVLVGRTTQPDRTVYAWSNWTWLGPLICMSLVLLLSRWQRLGIGPRSLLFMTILVGIPGLVFAFVAVFEPGAYDVVVDAKHFETRSGGKPINVRYDDLAEIRVSESWSLGVRRGIPYPSHSSKLVVVYKGGGVESFVVGGLLERALPEIVERARQQGVRIAETND